MVCFVFCDKTICNLIAFVLDKSNYNREIELVKENTTTCNLSLNVASGINFLLFIADKV